MEYIIVGSGLTGATIASQLKIWDRKITVYEKRGHIGGNVYTEYKDGIHIHKYGPHIFHTNSAKIWSFINLFGKFHNYQHRVKAKYGSYIYTLPVNLSTFNEIKGDDFNPKTMKEYFDTFTKKGDYKNLEEYALTIYPLDIYNRFFKGYTKKQWNKDPKDLPASIIARLPVRFNYDDRWFTDLYQGIPVDGYTKIIERMLDGVDVHLLYDINVMDIKRRPDLKVIFTGPIDRAFDYCFGKLEYRSLRFEEQWYDRDDFQGIAQMNYTEESVPYTRIVEHKHFDYGCQNTERTVITKEYPQDYTGNNEPYYPINNYNNNQLYQKYRKFAKDFFPHIIFCGRLGSYQYYNMDQAIGQALTISERILREE